MIITQWTPADTAFVKKFDAALEAQAASDAAKEDYTPDEYDPEYALFAEQHDY